MLSLLGFNLGIELTQLLVVALVGWAIALVLMATVAVGWPARLGAHEAGTTRVVVSFTAFFFAGYVIWTKCHGR